MSRVAAAGLAALILSGAAFAEELVAPVSLEAVFLDPAAEGEVEPIAGAPLILSTRFRDTLLDRPHRLRQPRGFLRPTAAAGGDCAEMARALRATGAFARGDIALDGYLIALLSREGRVSVVDPQISLATSNILRVIDLGERPRDFVVNPRGAMFATLAQRDALARIDAASGVVAAIEGVAAPLAIAPTPTGVATVARDGTALLIAGAQRRRVALSFAASGVNAAADGSLLFFNSAGRLAHVAASGRVTGAIDMSADAIAFAYAPKADAVVALSKSAPQEATLHFLDGGAPLRIALAHAADTLFVTPDGRHAVAVARAQGAASIVDLATGRTVQAVAFDGALSDVGFSDRSIFFLLDERRTAALLARDSIAKGKEPAIRRIPLGAAGDIGEDAGLTTQTPDGGALLVASPARDAVFSVADAGLHESASLASINIKGDPPVRLLTIPRGLRDVGQGRYEALVAFARSGPHRLVVFDSGNAPLICRNVMVRPSAAEAARAAAAPEIALVVSALRRTDAGVEIGFKFDASSPIASGVRALIAQSLSSAWRAQAKPTPTDEGYRVTLANPHPGPIALYAVFGDGARSTPSVVEIAP